MKGALFLFSAFRRKVPVPRMGFWSRRENQTQNLTVKGHVETTCAGQRTCVGRGCDLAGRTSPSQTSGFFAQDLRSSTHSCEARGRRTGGLRTQKGGMSTPGTPNVKTPGGKRPTVYSDRFVPSRSASAGLQGFNLLDTGSPPASASHPNSGEREVRVETSTSRSTSACAR